MTEEVNTDISTTPTSATGISGFFSGFASAVQSTVRIHVL